MQKIRLGCKTIFVNFYDDCLECLALFPYKNTFTRDCRLKMHLLQKISLMELENTRCPSLGVIWPVKKWKKYSRSFMFQIFRRFYPILKAVKRWNYLQNAQLLKCENLQKTIKYLYFECSCQNSDLE